MAIETAERWARGEATRAEVRAALNEACVATSAYDNASDDATWATAKACDNAALTAAIIEFPSCVATFAASFRAQAPLVREHLPLSVVVCAALGLRDPLPLRFDVEVAA